MEQRGLIFSDWSTQTLQRFLYFGSLYLRSLLYSQQDRTSLHGAQSLALPTTSYWFE
jgi:hypothetical protein